MRTEKEIKDRIRLHENALNRSFDIGGLSERELRIIISELQWVLV
jgi:hypothetical protein